MPRHWRDRIPGLLRRAGRQVAGSRRPPPMDAAVRERLTAYYEPFNRELAGLIDRDLSAWMAARTPVR